MSPERGLLRFRASSRSFESDAPGLTSPAIGIGMIRSSWVARESLFRPFGAFLLEDTRLLTALLIGGLREIVQLPLPDQALGVGFAGSCSEREQVRGAVNIERDAGQRK